ncbi:uncharacterized protein BO97DRAFT_63024 [Aspergillus homomorphus CBS 101889]|uniref:Uncharacterized protein n=1 Tax=Aspergillus homomorphus (strain CBS 101889) TaxID=1450537 RepID=A0A395HWR9_ASPHC|nr:hypothetical protein BO97DRAFT_63024 [Aspergillus homomorphus CBS 101889]RAL12240.1 hypothetical protein BO97DRAFT_63024 [Aspergillus homomorphus CBS 101889]
MSLIVVNLVNQGSPIQYFFLPAFIAFCSNLRLYRKTNKFKQQEAKKNFLSLPQLPILQPSQVLSLVFPTTQRSFAPPTQPAVNSELHRLRLIVLASSYY